jgi:hypothetical protein
MKSFEWFLIVLALIAFIFAGVMVYAGFDKINNYYSSADYPSLNKNAYVGGDAYNYIINAEYATGYFILALIGVITGFGLILMTIFARITSNLQQINFQGKFSKSNEVNINSIEQFNDLPKL